MVNGYLNMMFVLLNHCRPSVNGNCMFRALTTK